ncbi:hypothetical protein [Cohnella soli]|uniref:Uncharacterized protein n=1 Tax=Cohnella soli TaxID=425005 RepID=A0ABW0HZ35_9BACL
MVFKLVATVLMSASLIVHEPTLFQVFDVKQGKVVQQRPLTSELEKSILSLLDNSPTLYGGLAMNPESGIVLHIVWDEPIQLASALYPEPIKEIYLFLEPGTQPKALIFLKDKAKYRVVVLQGNSDQFMWQNKLYFLHRTSVFLNRKIM